MRVLEGVAVAALLAFVVYNVSDRPSAKGGSERRSDNAATDNSLAEDDPSNPSDIQTPAQQAVWDADQRKVARSWLEGYCEWAWAHDLSVFPAVSTVKNQIVTDDHSDAEVRYSLAGRELSGRCSFTDDGRAVPKRLSRGAPLAGDGTEEQSAEVEPFRGTRQLTSRPPQTGALIDGLVYAPPLPASDGDGAPAGRAWFPVLMVSLHGEPMHGIDGYMPKYAYHSHDECLDAARRNIGAMARAGIRVAFMCMYHGEPDREMSRLPMEDF